MIRMEVAGIYVARRESERASERECVRACVRCSGVRARPICLTQRTTDGAAIRADERVQLRAAGEQRASRQPAYGE